VTFSSFAGAPSAMVRLPLLLLLLVSSLLVCGAAGVSASAPPPLPEMPEAYSAVIAANYIDRNFTVSYEEFYDNVTDTTTPVLRTNGRYAPSNQGELLRFGGALTSQIFSTEDGASGCQSFTLVNATARMNLGPSKSIFDTFVSGADNLQYIGRSDSSLTRFIVCDEWTGSYSRSRRNVTTTWSFTYFAATPATVGLEYAPVRLEVIGSTTDNRTGIPQVSSIHQIIDWVKFSFQTPLPTRFAQPTGCDPIPPGPNTLPIRTFRGGNNFFPNDTLPPAPYPTSFPKLPSNFRMTLEAKVDPFHPNGGFHPPPQVSTYTWSLNQETLSDRLDYLVLTEATNPSGGANIVGEGQFSRLDIGSNDPAIVGGATIYEFRRTSTDASCTTSPLSLQNQSPLEARRAGSLHNLFSGLPRDDEYRSGQTFVGRTTLRGVEVDHWTSSHTKLNGEAFYSFQMDVFMFNSEWRFPGRQNLDPDMGIPMRVINQGTWINSSVSAPIMYTVSWCNKEWVGLFAHNPALSLPLKSCHYDLLSGHL
jgi:hypothetical protein